MSLILFRVFFEYFPISFIGDGHWIPPPEQVQIIPEQVGMVSMSDLELNQTQVSNGMYKLTQVVVKSDTRCD